MRVLHRNLTLLASNLFFLRFNVRLETDKNQYYLVEQLESRSKESTIVLYSDWVNREYHFDRAMMNLRRYGLMFDRFTYHSSIVLLSIAADARSNHGSVIEPFLDEKKFKRQR